MDLPLKETREQNSVPTIARVKSPLVGIVIFSPKGVRLRFF
ncbi:hypothetical protein HSIEG1_329 [Enterococcus sp. HSIEG1]|nr:hypothetical protein HSIEG1_329 [Enterococcus sp. HSIEG1]